MIIIKDVPELTTRELLEALNDLNPDGIQTGYGGFVVDEYLAEQFLFAYLVAMGRIPAPTSDGADKRTTTTKTPRNGARNGPTTARKPRRTETGREAT